MGAGVRGWLSGGSEVGCVRLGSMISTDLPPMPTGDADRTMVELSPNTPEPPSRSPRPKRPMTRRRRIVRRVAAAFAVLLLVAGAVAWWALDRFVIDHVEVGDVAAYEAEAPRASDGRRASTTTATDDADDAVAADSARRRPPPRRSSPTRPTTSDTMSITISTVVDRRSGDAPSPTTSPTSTLADATDAAVGVRREQVRQQHRRGHLRHRRRPTTPCSRSTATTTASATPASSSATASSTATTAPARASPSTPTARWRSTTRPPPPAEELLAAGVWNTLSFGPALLDDGAGRRRASRTSRSTPTSATTRSRATSPAPAIGIIDDNHFVFVVVDGRSPGYSAGVTMTELAEIIAGPRRDRRPTTSTAAARRPCTSTASSSTTRSARARSAAPPTSSTSRG